MKITLCGSMQFEPRMAELSRELAQRGYEIDKPDVVEGHVYADNLDANAELKRGFIDEHIAKIQTSEAILVVNETKNGVEHYIGGNTLMEIAYAYSQGLDIFLLNPVPDMGYADEIRGMHPIVLNGSLDALDDYVASLPLVYMSTERAVKHGPVSRAFRRAGIKVRVDGKKVDSGVNEQPITAEETYEGARNRQKNLKSLGVTADYYVTVESGLHTIHTDHSKFGCTVVIVEPAGQPPKVGIDLDVEFPQEWLDKVPSVHADLGVLVQEEFGAPEKDPTTYVTNGKLTRRTVIENATYNVIAQLEIKEDV